LRDNVSVYATIRPEEFLSADAFGPVLDECTGPIAAVRDHLSNEHGALLGLTLDLGVIPAADRLRSTRDAGPVVRALADLETLGLLVPAGEDRLALASRVDIALEDGLRAAWRARADAARRTISSLGTGDRAAGDNLVRTWLRHLLIFASHRGLRRTASGELHWSDVRRYDGVAALPPRTFLEQVAHIGVGLGVFLDVGDRLLVGPQVDLLDLPPLDLFAAFNRAWVGGRIPLGHTEINGATGIFSTWNDAVTAAADPGARPLVAAVSPDPATPLIDDWGRFDLRDIAANVSAAQARVRERVVATLEGLPRGADIPLASLSEALAAEFALAALDEPVYVDRRATAPPARVFAAGLAPLPWFARRTREGLVALLRVLAEIHGGAAVAADHVRLTAPPPLPGGPTTLTAQPNGDVIAPPDSSIHALVHLACGAHPTKLDVLSTFTIDRRSLMRLCDAGIDVTEWGDLLAQWAGGQLPGTLMEQLSDVARRHGELRLVPAGAVLIADDPVRMAELLSHKTLAKAVLLQPSPTVVVLREGIDLPTLLEDLGDRGFSAIVTSEPPG
jgi:hypothetical protein